MDTATPTDPISADMPKTSINILDVIILGALITAGAYWLFRKKKPEFDASQIKTFTIE